MFDHPMTLLGDMVLDDCNEQFYLHSKIIVFDDSCIRRTTTGTGLDFGRFLFSLRSRSTRLFFVSSRVRSKVAWVTMINDTKKLKRYQKAAGSIDSI